MSRLKPQEVITLADADTAATLATTGYRPKANALDAYIGFDGATGGFNGTAAPLAIGSPVSISNYIGSSPDDSTWKERLTLTSKTLKVPLDVQAGVPYEVSGPEVAKPLPATPGFQKAYFKAGYGLCAIDSAGAEKCMGGGPTAKTEAAPEDADTPWFTAIHVEEKAAVFSSVPGKAAFFGVVLPFPKITTQLTYTVGGADTSSTTYDIGIYSGTPDGLCTLLAHTGPRPGRSAMTPGYHTVDWKNGAVRLRPGRYYLAMTASSTKSSAVLGGESNRLTFAGGTGPDTVGNVELTISGELDATRVCPTDSYKTAIVPAFVVH